MKKITTLLFLMFSISIYSQWVQKLYDSSINLNDVYCVSENVVIVVGDAGIILKTIDGGTNWVPKTSGTSDGLTKIEFVNAQVGYVVGKHGTLLKTSDDGESWTPIATGTTSYLSGLSCVNENIFFIGADASYIRKTINGGLSFEIVNLDQSGFKDNIQFLNEMTGYANTYDGLYKTIDGGTSWFIIHNNVFSFFFLNENVGFVNATDGLNKTIDGGDTYTYLTDIPFVMHKVFATSENVVWGVTQDFYLNGQPNYTMRGEINDLGEFQKTVTHMPTFDSVYFANPTTGYGIADFAIYKNSTGLLRNVKADKIEDNIKIYPNPASDKITISFPDNTNQPYKIEITNCLGEKILSKLDQALSSTINVESLEKGVYFITIITQDKRETRKIIIK